MPWHTHQTHHSVKRCQTCIASQRHTTARRRCTGIPSCRSTTCRSCTTSHRSTCMPIRHGTPPQLYHHIKWARSTALSSNKRSCSSSKGKPVTWALSGCTQARSMACSEQPRQMHTRQMHTQCTSLGRPHPVTQPCRIMPTPPGRRPYSRHSRRSGCHPRLARCRTQTSLDPQWQQVPRRMCRPPFGLRRR